jgi:tetratricopeptide (TPR) repeat protein/transcriptional regulator with XRE-family HTH domain
MAESKENTRPRIHLTAARMKRGWSQQEVAERIGTTHLNVSRWERGITRPTPFFRKQLCSLFGMSEQALDLEHSPDDHDDTPTREIQARAGQVLAPMEVTPVAAPIYDPAIPLRPLNALVGRKDELARLKARLLSGGVIAITALNGLPGVGKTALAIALAYDEELRVHFRDGILWAGLGPQVYARPLLSHWGSLLGISATEAANLSSDEAWAIAIKNAIGARAMLLIVDDVWELQHALTFKVGGPNCAMLFTTRFTALASQLDLAGTTTVRELDEAESINLLRILAPEIVEREEQRIRDLVQAVGGLPLALTLIGNYLRKEYATFGGHRRRITAALNRLSKAEERLQLSEEQAATERHTSLTPNVRLSLQAIFDVTVQQLSNNVRLALYALAVFPPKPNSFSEEAALAVAHCDLDTLDTLTLSGLLEYSAAERYTLHQTIADYARLQLHDSAPYERLIRYVIEYVEAHRKDYELLEMENEIILAALDRAHELALSAQLVRATLAIAPFLLLRGHYQLAEHYLQRARAAAASTADTRGLTGALLYLGEVAQKQGNYAQSVATLQEGLTLARALDDKERISALLNNLGWVQVKLGEFAQAETALQEGLTLARALGEKERMSGILRILGTVFWGKGDYAQSEIYLQEGLTIARELGDREQMCVFLMSLGVNLNYQGHYERAEQYLKDGLVLARQIGHREWISGLLVNLGDTLYEQGNYPEAEAYFREGLQLAQQIGQRDLTSVLLTNIGMVLSKQGDYVQAEKYLQDSLALAKQIGLSQFIPLILYEFGNLYLYQDKLVPAQQAFQEMLTVIPEGNQDLIALSQYGLARVAALQGNMQEAYQLAETSLAMLKMIGHRKAKEVEGWLDALKATPQ